MAGEVENLVGWIPFRSALARGPVSSGFVDPPFDARSPSKKPVIKEIIVGSRSTRDRDR